MTLDAIPGLNLALSAPGESLESAAQLLDGTVIEFVTVVPSLMAALCVKIVGYADRRAQKDALDVWRLLEAYRLAFPSPPQWPRSGSAGDPGDNRADEAGMFIRLGDPPAPVPAPFDQVIRDYLSARPNLTTATNPGSRWLFPGPRAGQPLHPTSIRLRLQSLGIPNLNGRSRALREMLLQAPPSVVGAMIGYAPARAEAIAAQAGGTWKQYAPGDHSRTHVAAGPS
jgi:hypothetical protein